VQLRRVEKRMAEIKAPEWPGKSNLHQRARPHTTIYSSAPSRRSRSRARPPYCLLDHLIRPLKEHWGIVRPRALAILRLITSSNVLSDSHSPFMFGDVQGAPLLPRQSHVP
jgi:hypothetical protein